MEIIENAPLDAIQIETLKELEFPHVLEIIKKFCFTAHAKELIMALLPNDDTEYLRYQHNLIDEMIELKTGDDPVPFEGTGDSRELLHKSMIENSALNPTELLTVSDSMRASRIIRNYFRNRSEKYPLLSAMAADLHDNILLEKHIADAIDDTGEVRDNASRELLRIRRELNEKSARLRSRIQKILKQVAEEDLIMEEFATIRDERFVIPVKSEHKRHIPGIIHGVSQTGATVFIEPTEVFEMNNEISLLKNEEKREIYKILSNLTSEIRADARKFLKSLLIIAQIDSISARARWALDFGGIKPDICDEDELSFKDLRHPLLVYSKEKKNVMPLSIDFDMNKRGHLISGPNAGGKTVALKSIGLNLALALSGIYPLGACRANYRAIYSSIGDHQSIENDLSTFSSQIKELKEILEHCTRQSLLLIDEIGSGTDPQEGSALAAGILDTFIELKLFFVATTHQSSLKSYALSRPVIDNASLEFDNERLKPTYRFMQGIPGNSYAFALAESLGLDKLTIERARSYIGSRQSELEESIAALQKFKSEAENTLIEARVEKQKADTLRLEYEKRINEIKVKKQKLIEQARAEAAEIVAEANALVENTIREIREKEKPLGEIKKEFNAQKQAIEKKIQPQPVEYVFDETPRELKTGDEVSVDGGADIGTIMEIDRQSGKAVVDFNGVKFRFALERLHSPNAQPRKLEKGYTDYMDFGANSRIDLRGERAEEAIRQVDDLISNALISNVDTLTIIHGKGTGALRAAIHEWLSAHPSVQSFRLGELVEGGSGVTIVQL
jgi:DNA mismatch repair protein MutS2